MAIKTLSDAIKEFATGVPTANSVEVFLKETASANGRTRADALRKLRDIEVKIPDIRTKIGTIMSADSAKFNPLEAALRTADPDFHAIANNTTATLAEQLKGISTNKDKVIDATDDKGRRKQDKKFEDLSAEEYAKKTDHNTKLDDSTRVKRNRHGEEIVTGGELGKIEKKITEAHKKLERARGQLDKPWNSDPKSSSAKTAKYEVTKLEKELESLGKQAQKEAHLAGKKLDEWMSGLEKSHSEHLDGIAKDRDKLVSALEDIKAKKLEVGGKKTASYEFKKKLGKDLVIELDGEKYHVTDKGGIIDKHGVPAKGKKFDDIMDAAKSHVNEHFDAELTRHEDAFERVKTEIKDRSEHVQKVKGDFSEKTKIGEWNGKTASKATVGGALAESKGVMRLEEYKGLSSAGKFGAKVKAVFNSGALGMAQCATGLGGILYFGSKAFQDLSNMMSSDPEKKADSSLVNLAIDGAGIVGSGFLMQLGGLNKVVPGHSKA